MAVVDGGGGGRGQSGSDGDIFVIVFASHFCCFRCYFIVAVLGVISLSLF